MNSYKTAKNKVRLSFDEWLEETFWGRLIGGTCFAVILFCCYAMVTLVQMA